ncbi:MAG: crotonase/enoyl-CoA hydratase family protein [Gammaproteobacteria bacterium]|nr:crotonase/enoyl-CoA hydratase family protein [Gammaproteobacteria bacterium]
MPYETIDYTVTDHILTLTLNRPEQMNAFTVRMANDLVTAFERASDDDEVRVIVVTGSGKAFCAGMDLSVDGNVFGLDETMRPTMIDMRTQMDSEHIARGVRDTGGRVALAIFACKKPVIAALNGAAVGIGATMTCAMDIRLLSTTARVGFVFNKIGITPEACSTWFLPKIVGLPTALEWCFTGDLLDADTLVNSGFARSTHAPEELLDAAYALAGKMVHYSPVAMALTRQMMYRNSVEPHPLHAHQVDSLAMFYTSITSGKEGVKSFLEKRAPQFTDKSSSDMPEFYPWW